MAKSDKDDKGLTQVHGNGVSQGTRILDAAAAERKADPKAGGHLKYLEHQMMRKGPPQGILTGGNDADGD